MEPSTSLSLGVLLLFQIYSLRGEFTMVYGPLGRVFGRKQDVDLVKKRTGGYWDPVALTQGQRMQPPTFKKYGTKAVFTKAMASWTGGVPIYFPCLVEMRSVLGSAALDTWYLYYSTDHASGAGGIGLATAPHPGGPWKDRGRVFVDTTAGEQTETPCVLYNENTGLFHMYYHQNYYAAGDTNVYRSQATCLATSPDGVTWTILKAPLITIPDGDFPGDGHTGYARVYRFNELWIMRHSMGGTNYSHNGISYSLDGINWTTDPYPILGNAEIASDGTTRKIGVNDVFQWRGRLWANVNENSWASGSGDSTSKVFVSPYNGPRKPGYGLYEILKVGGAGAWDEKSIRNVTITEYEDKLYLFYEGVNAAGDNAFGLAIGEA
ncbi:hypothetical protein ACFSL6_08900 [Paenibacillus thailandensis]|uniref:Glycosyl hydrolase n=1 Tax=Paenibacillus thailandensis TaxID=393250 RepID=A0ABW5QTQ7_9BACL